MDGEGYELFCNATVCNGGLVRIGYFNDDTGFINFPKTSIIKTSIQLRDAVLKLFAQAEPKINFCILACFSNPNFIKQALTFPPRTRETMHLVAEKPVNVNVVLLDSVSRQHFYRKLPATIDVLKNMKSSGETLVYDFNLFQSIAPRTFPNVRALFSGKIDVDSNDEDFEYNLGDLAGYFKKVGYQNLLQEDSCWHDVWGSLITDNKHMENVSNNWSGIHEKIKRLPIDDFGLSHLSCEVFQQYGKTNQFNHPPKVCYNGHLLPSYYLNYTYEFLRNIEARIDSKPGFLYTHLNTAHEATGKRVAQMDYLLADFVSKLEKLTNTITVLLSDHGPKTTKFAQKHLAGRLEIGHAFMFILIPEKAQYWLGEEKIKALDHNQNILFSMLDLYSTFKTLRKSAAGEGLLKPLPRDRFCDGVPMYSFMNCLCEGGTEVLTEKASFRWIAEFVVGYLNQLITQSLLSTGTQSGYGNCERLIGSRFNKIRRKKSVTSSYDYYVVDILVHKYRGEEIFEVVVRIRKRLFAIEVVKWRRVSIYQHFSKCCDREVDIQLCICRAETQDIPNPGRDLARQLSIQSFGVNTESAFLDSKCLLLMKRERSNLFRTYEIANMCTDRIYHTNFTIDNSVDIHSTTLVPVYTTVKPWFIYYITTITLLHDGSANPQETIAFKIENL